MSEGPPDLAVAVSVRRRPVLLLQKAAALVVLTVPPGCTSMPTCVWYWSARAGLRPVTVLSRITALEPGLATSMPASP